MKHKNTLETHLHRIQQLQRELAQRKEDLLEEQQRLNTLHGDILARIDSQGKDGINAPQPSNLDDLSRCEKGDNVDIVNHTSQVFEQAQYRLKDLVKFLDSSNTELSAIKITFQNEYPHQDQADQEPHEETRRKDMAVRKMTDNLESLRRTVSDKLDSENSRQDVDSLLSKLNMAVEARSERSRSKTRLATVGVPQPGATITGQKRSSSVSKERLLNKAKQVRAAKGVQLPSSGSSCLTASTAGLQVSDKVQENGDAPANSQDKNDDKSASSLKSTVQNQDGGFSGSDPKEQPAEIIQVQEVTSSVQENIRGRIHSSFGESMTESSIMTSSTVSALLGDSSLQSAMSSDRSDVKEASGSDSSLDSVSPSAGEEVSEDHNSSSELVAKHQEALLSRARMSKGGSRYIQVGLSEPQAAWEGGRYLQKTNPRLYRPFYSPYSRGGRSSPGIHLPGPSSPRRNAYRRSQSSHPANRHPWYAVPHGYFSPLHTTRRSQSSYPAYRPGKVIAGRFREADLQNGLIRLEATCPSLVPSSGQEAASWRAEQAREGLNGRRNGVSSVGSSASSDSPTHENGSEGRSDEDQQDEVDVCPLQSKAADKGLVIVKLVTSDHVQKHRGPGLVDHHTPADCFKYPREKSLEELTDFIHKRLRQSTRGRLRLWLFEEDDDGMFLPRRMLKGHFTKRTVGSLNMGTVTLYVQIAERQERLHAFDHHKVRFVFVKTPHWDTGEFVVKGHHHIDINKATRAVIQILKKKFMPQCPSSLRLYVETGGKKMYCVPHTAASSFDQDTGGRSRQGDILVLLEDFIGQHTALATPSYLPQPQLVPLAPGPPFYQPPNGTHSEGAASASGGESSLGSDDQDDCAVSVTPESPAPGEEAGHDRPKAQTALDTSAEREVNFIIPFDYTSSSTSEGSPVSPGDGSNTRGGSQNGAGPKRQLLQWNLTNNYMSRFSHIKEGGSLSSQTDLPAEGGPAETDEKEGLELTVPEVVVEYDSVEVSTGRISMTSVEYESLVVSSIDGEMLGEDSGSRLLAPDANRAAAAAAIRTKVMEVHSSLQLSADSRPAAVVVSAEEECTRVSVTELSPSQVLVATINVSETSNVTGSLTGDSCCEDGNGSTVGDLNPVAPVFTPRTRLRIQQLGRRRFDYHSSDGNSAGVQERGKIGSRGRNVDEKLKGQKEAHNVTLSPKTPRMSGHSVLASDEDVSVYYTPGPAFIYPDAHPRLQSTAIPLADMNNSDSPNHPDQISAITNRSSSFMALRLPRPPSVGMEQISAIPNISTSFMEIPSQIQLHNSSLTGHSASISQRHCSGSYHPEPSFVIPASPRPHFPKSIETSHLQASYSALPLKASLRQTVRRTSRSGRGPGRSQYRPTFPHTDAQDGEERRRGRSRSEASAVKQEDPAIMDIGKQVFAQAQKSSLNAMATEFVPKEAAGPPQHDCPERHAVGRVPEGIPHRFRPPPNPFTSRGHPPAPRLFHPLTGTQGGSRTVPQSERPPPSVMPRPAPYPPPAPAVPAVGKITSSNLYSALKQQSGALTTFTPPKPPILISLTDGSRAALPPKPRSDTSRHVTFADPPIRNVQMAPRRSDPSAGYNNPRYSGYPPLTPAPAMKAAPPSRAEPAYRQDTYRHDLLGRRKIGSGRFDDRPKRYTGELRKSVPRTAIPFQPQHSDPPAPSSLRKHPSSHPKTYSYHNGSAENGYTNGRYGQPFADPHGLQRTSLRRRDDVEMYGNGECLPPLPPPRPRMDHYRNDFQLYRFNPRSNGFPPHPQSGRFPPEDRGYAKGPSFSPEDRSYAKSQNFPPEERVFPKGPSFTPEELHHLNPYKMSRSSYRPPSMTGFRGGPRPLPRAASGGAPPGMDFRFRRPIRAQPASNTSSDQSDCSVQNGRQRFRPLGHVVQESETETSLGSVTFHSDGSQGTDSVSERTAEGAAMSPPSNGCSRDSSDNKTGQSSGSCSSRQSVRLRRGYIQLGLGPGARPTMARGD